MNSVVGTIIYHIACRESKCFLFTNDDGFVCVRIYICMVILEQSMSKAIYSRATEATEKIDQQL